MYPKLIALIDVQLDRLTRARTLLVEPSLTQEIVQAPASVKQAPPPAPEPVVVTRVRSSRRGIKKGIRGRAARSALETALTGSVVSGPVVGAAAEIRRRPEPGGASEAPAPAVEGTLNALIEELTGAGRASKRPEEETARH